MADQLSGPPGLDDPGGFYRQLFSAMNDGVCLHELVYDDMGRPGDYRILDVNPRYEEILGLGRDAVVGKTAMQVYGTKDPPYLDIFAEVAQTGSATHFETYCPPLEKHFRISVFSPAKGVFATVFQDITRRKTLEEEQEERENKHRIIAENLQEAIILQAADGEILIWNKAAEDIFDIPKNKAIGSTGEMLGLKNVDLQGVQVPLDEYPSRRTLRTGKPVSGEVMGVPRKEGGHTWISVNTSPLYREKDWNPYAVAISANDITRQKKVEDKLAESEAKLRHVVENSPNMFYSHLPDGTFTYLSPKAKSMLGINPDNESAKWQEFVTDHPANKIVEEATERALETGQRQPPYEIQIKGRDGNIKWVQIVESPVVQEGETVSIVGSLNDVTDRRKAETALRESENMLQTIMGSVDAGIGLVDKDRNFKWVNQKFLDMTGYSLKEIAGRSAVMIYPTEDEFKRVGMQRQNVNLRNQAQAQTKTVFRHKDGSLVHVLLTTAPVSGKDLSKGTVFSVMDITATLQAEKKAREQEIRFTNLFETARDGVLIIKDNRAIECNQAVQDMFKADKNDLIGKHPVALSPEFQPDGTRSLEAARKKFQATKEEGTTFFEWTHLRMDGRTFIAEIGLNMVQVEEEEVMMAVVRDISDRLKSEQILRESEAHYRSVVRAAPIGIGVVADRVISQVNEKLCQIVGFSRQELLGKNARVLYPTFEDYAYVGREKYSQIFDYGTGVVETRFQRKDGHIIDVLLSSAPLDEHDLSQGVTFTALDITKRKQAEFALAEAKQEFESIFENSQVGIAHLRGGRVLHRGNQRLAEIFGYDFPEEMARKSVRQFHLDKEHYEDFGQLFYAALTMEEQIQIEYQLKRKDGSPIWCSLSGKALDPSDLDQGVIWVVDELESRKALENDLMQAIELSEAANRAKSEFLANMSHEIRTPLNGIMGMLQVMQATDLDQEQQEYVDIAAKSSKRLARLLNDILDLSKIEADRLEIREDVFSLPEAMQSIKDIFAHVARENENILETHHDPALPEKLIGDSTRLTQILFNLVGNAAKYTHQGRIEVHVALLPEIQNNVCRVLFTISDTGTGIPDDKMDTVFETFTQAGNTLSPYTRQHEGAGLGLPLVKRLVKLMDGNVAVDSCEGVGTTVYVSLPFRIPGAAGSSGDGDRAEMLHDISRDQTILVVEDDRTTQLYLRKILEKSGVCVEVAENGQEALAKLYSSRFDCILMDIQMPVLDGVEATKKIRAMAGEIKDIPIIALTAYAMAGDREKFLAFGMDDYIAKPVEKDELIETLKRNLTE